MKTLALLLSLVLATPALAVEAGSANQVMRIPSGGGMGKFGSMDLGSSAAVGTSKLRAVNGGTNLDTSGSTGVPSISAGTWSVLPQLSTALGGFGQSMAAATGVPSWAAGVLTLNTTVPESLGGTGLAAFPYDASSIANCSVTASVGSSALTVSLKDAAGNTPSATSPCKIAFRSSTAGTGTVSWVSVTSATTVVVSSGSTLGCVSGNTCLVHVYAINNAGTVELAVSTSKAVDLGNVVTTTAEGGAGAADSRTGLYSTTARSGVAARLIARMTANQATAGTWATTPTLISSGDYPPYAPITGDTTLNRVEYMSGACSSSSSISAQSGSWISSIGNISAGGCQVNFASGYWSGTPRCVIATHGDSNPNTNIATYNPTTTEIIAVCKASGASCTSWQFNMICMGAR